MGLLTDDVTRVKPVLEVVRPAIEHMLGPVGFVLVDGHWSCTDFHGNVFKVWVNDVTHEVELEQI
jgi:hypothetical protein